MDIPYFWPDFYDYHGLDWFRHVFKNHLSRFQGEFERKNRK